MAATLLVELLTEELPPKALRRLAETFGDSLAAALRDGLLPHAESVRCFATPRRLAVMIPGVLEKAADLRSERTGPSVSAGPEAARGFARKCGVPVESLEKHRSAKGEVWLARFTTAGAKLKDVLAQRVAAALKALPIPKLMRWGDGEAQFARPVHGLVMMHGKRVVAGSVLGVPAGNLTRGHRFMGAASIRLSLADEYETRLRKSGMVIADFEIRRAKIKRQLKTEAKKHQASLGSYHDLLEEVTALVEYPAVYAGEFDRAFLEVPQECVVLTMRQHQKYFPLFNATGKLLPRFLIVSNMKVANPRHIVGGNERVVRARLADAKFFFEQDKKKKLADRVEDLARVIYHNKLGSQLERVDRIEDLAKKISNQLKADESLTARAARLCKADLLTGMVGEFPELQGIMGRYYALHDGEPAPVADAIAQHYRPRFAGDRLPEGPLACAVALADKLDTIAGLFSIGQQPTGDKDPFGLRRAALGIVRILVENRLQLSLYELAKAAFEPFKAQAPVDLNLFIYDRFTSYLKEQGYSTLQIDSVLSKHPVNLGVVPDQLEAVKAFQLLPEAESLATANKRIVNILKQAEAKGEAFTNAEAVELKEPAERALHEAIHRASEKAKPLYEKGDYAGYLRSFSVLKAPIDAFFDSVKVMADDPAIRRGRLALLHDLREAMNRVADISRLAK
jgi:glycyl-tRNA synthetase beta chain